MELYTGIYPPEALDGQEYVTLKAQGKRRTMEDFSDVAHFDLRGSNLSCFSIFDGHGGRHVAEYCARAVHLKFFDLLDKDANMSIEEALQKAYVEVDGDLEASTKRPALCCGKLLGWFVQDSLFVGSTGVTVVVSETEITMAHVGDSRALLVSSGKLEAATMDHRALHKEESSRILSAGGKIERGMVTGPVAYFAQHYLGMSRAFGDFSHKRMPGVSRHEQAVICVPEVATCKRTDANDFLLIASDGLWCVMYNEEAVDLVSKRLQKGLPLEVCCRALAYECLVTRGSTDNLALTLVKL